VIGGASAAFASSVTTPSTSPFNVPGNAAGSPLSFTIFASPFPQGPSVAFVEQCDGVSPASDPNYSPLDHCDAFSSTSKVDVGPDGVANFPANDANFGFFPFKGLDSLHRWNCIAPGDPNPGNGKPVYTNCQIRVSIDQNNFQSSDAYATMTLPAPAPPNPTCHMGDGIPQVPPKPNKNAGLDKIAAGLLPTAAAKDTKHKLTGTLDNCTNTPTAVKTGTPLDAGSIQVQAEMAPGANCTNMVVGAVVKSKVTIKWNAHDNKANKDKTVATDKATLASFTQVGTGAPLHFHAVTSAFDPLKSVFFGGMHAEIDFRMDETQAQLDTACNDAKGKGIFNLHFTALSNSTLTVMP
jgi:hypothetical protein